MSSVRNIRTGRNRNPEVYGQFKKSDLTVVSVLVFMLPIAATVGPWLNDLMGLPLYPAVLAGTALGLTISRVSDRTGEKWFGFATAFIIAWAFIAVVRFGLGVEDNSVFKSALSILLPNLLIIVAAYRSPAKAVLLRAILAGWFISTTIVVMVCTWEVATGRHLSNVGAALLIDDESFLSSTFGNPNALAYFVCLTLPLFAVFALKREIGLSKRVLCGLSVLVLVLILAGTDSVIGIATLFVELLILVVFYRRRGRSVRALAALAISIAGAAITVGYVRSLPADRFHAIVAANTALESTVQGLQGELNTVGVRLALLDAAVRLVAERPISGHGAGQFPVAMGSRSEGATTAQILSPHNGLAEIAVEYGLPVFFMAMTAAALLILSVYRLTKAESRGTRSLAVICLVQSVAQILLISANSTYLQAPWMWLWVLFVVVVCSGHNTEMPYRLRHDGVPEYRSENRLSELKEPGTL